MVIPVSYMDGKGGVYSRERIYWIEEPTPDGTATVIVIVPKEYIQRSTFTVHRGIEPNDYMITYPGPKCESIEQLEKQEQEIIRKWEDIIFGKSPGSVRIFLDREARKTMIRDRWFGGKK